MAFTLSEMRTMVRDATGLDATDGHATDTILTSLINRALRTAAAEERWDWYKASETITLVAGTSTYARAATARATDRLINTTTTGQNTPLRLVTPSQLERYRARSAGMPVAFAVEGGSLVVAPTPSAAGTLRHVYWRTETTLLGDSDTALIPDWAIDLVIIRAALSVAARLDNASLTRQLKDEEVRVTTAIMDEMTRSRPPIELDHRGDWGV